MDVQGIHSEVIWIHVQAVEHLPQGDLLATLLGHSPVRFCLVCVLDEAQQVLLVHAGSCVDVRVYLQHSAHQPMSPGPPPLAARVRAPNPQHGAWSHSTLWAVEAAPTNAWVPFLL